MFSFKRIVYYFLIIIIIFLTLVTFFSIYVVLTMNEQRDIELLMQLDQEMIYSELRLIIESYESTLNAFQKIKDENLIPSQWVPFLLTDLNFLDDRFACVVYSQRGYGLWSKGQSEVTGWINEVVEQGDFFPLKQERFMRLNESNLSTRMNPESERVLYFFPVSDWNLVFVVGGSSDLFTLPYYFVFKEAEEKQAKLITCFGIAIGFIVILSSLLIVFMFSRKVSQFINNILDFFDQATQGDASFHGVSFGYSEFQHIADAAVQMTVKLQDNLEFRLKVEEEKTLILNSMKDGYILINKDFDILDANPAAVKIFELDSKEELVGHKCYEVLFGKDSPCSDCGACFPAPEDETSLQERILPDGRIYNESYTPVYKKEVLTGIVLVVSDITDIKKQQVEITKSADNLKVTLESIGDAVISTDRHGFITMMNTYASELTGWEKRKALGVNVSLVYSIFHAVTGGGLENPVFKVLSSGKKISESKYQQMVTSEGETVAVSYTAAPIIDERQRLSGVVLVFRDISEETLREQQLAQMEYVLENLPGEIYFLDRQGRFTYANNQARKTYNLDDTSLVEKTIFMVDSDYSQQEFFKDQKKILVEGALHREFSRQGNGETLRYIDSRSFLVTLGGEWLRCVFENDISDKKRMETQLIQGQKMQAVGQLVGGIAHDFNNLLCGIIGYSEVLSKRLENAPKEQRYAKTIFSTATRASTLTSQLLSFSHNKNYVLEPMDVHDCINDAIRLLLRSIDKKIGIHRSLHCPHSVITGDTTQLQNAFLNLGINARDAMPTGGELRISTWKMSVNNSLDLFYGKNLVPGDYIAIQFSDSGIGMDVETTKRIFDPFFTTKEIGEGTGLGLAAVYGTVKKHGGDISVKTAQGVGTDFQILLPLNKNSQVNKVFSPEETNIENSMNGTILVVDDETILLSLLTDFLEDQGFTVLSALNGQEAVELYALHKDEILCTIMDIIMPVKDGYTAIKEIREEDPLSKIIVVSGFSGEDSSEKLDRSGAEAFIQKPYQMQDLLMTIQEVIAEGAGV